MTTYTPTVTTRQARRLGSTPATPADRRRRADYLMSIGAATWAAIVAAWYAGDDAAVRAEVYAGCVGAKR